MKALIKAKNLTKIYGETPNETRAVDDVSFEIKKGEFVAIIGPSGSGKSTLMHILGCLDHPTSGQYFLEDKNVASLSDRQLAEIRNQKIGFVFQFFNLLARTTAAKNAQLPLVYSHTSRTEAEKRAKEVLTAVGLANKFDSTPAQLSGGQQQRVAIARALVNNPLIIFADEPTGNLDTRSSYEIMAILKKLNSLGNTIVIITHEPDIAQMAKRIITIRDGKLTSDRIAKIRRSK